MPAPASPPSIRRALVSVHDKNGLGDFARALHAEFGIEIISTGGTAKLLRDSGIPVTLVEDVTGFPEMLDGRVKTLHPKIHAAILADRDNPEHMRQLAEQGIDPIDMVVVNLYPFDKLLAEGGHSFEEMIEMIDIGGPCLLRAAAKNHKHVLPVTSPDSYDVVLGALRSWSDPSTRDDARASGAFSVFWDSVAYDGRVAEWLSAKDDEGRPLLFVRRYHSWGPLRYGENPHQRAQLIDEPNSPGPSLATADGENLCAQADLSYNNYLDADTAFRLCAELCPRFEGPTHAAVFIKHQNPCGAGTSPDPLEAYRRAYLGDPQAAMGGVLAVSFEVGSEQALPMMESLDRWGRSAGAGAFFIEVWVAPSFSDEAIETIRSSRSWGKRIRLLEMKFEESAPNPVPSPVELEMRSIQGAYLIQQRDQVGLDEHSWKVASRRTPSETELADLRLAWLICKHTKSNAISICRDGMLLGNGAGQMSRVMSCRIATWLARENGHADALPGAVAASDAFFPFRDGVDVLLDAGVRAIIQPGGSKRDDEVIAACNERDVALILTGTRHFRH